MYTKLQNPKFFEVALTAILMILYWRVGLKFFNGFPVVHCWFKCTGTQNRWRLFQWSSIAMRMAVRYSKSSQTVQGLGSMPIQTWTKTQN